MDEKKIVAIIHMTDENACKEAMLYLQKLKVPQGFTFDILPVEGAKKYPAYNFAMKSSDAQYKIYIDEKVIVRQENILAEIIKIFKSDKNIGMIGCSGAVQLSTNGVCVRSAKRCGKVQMGNSKDKIQDWGGIDKDYREVEAIDGWFMATQYDIPFHEEFATLADSAQCLEFRRQNYKVVVARQKKPWLWYKSTVWGLNEEDVKKFLDEYSKELFPLVSIIMPTYNRPQWFKEALDSALAQTYRNIEIFITDNSKNEDTKKLMQPYLEKYPFIKYEYHPEFNASDNWNLARAYNNPDAEFVNWLLDDDRFYPTKLEKMVEIFRNNPDVSVVTSVRDVINEKGEVTGKMLMPRPEILNKDIKMKGEDAGKLIFNIGKNFIGEPTTALIRKKCLRNNDLCWTEEETGFFPLIDISTWMQLLTQGSLFYIANDSLSAFRRHSEQATNWIGSGPAFEVCWAKLIKTSWDKKAFHKTEHDVRMQILNWIYSASLRLVQTAQIKLYNDTTVMLEKCITAMSQALYNGYKIELPERKFAPYSTDGNNVFG